MLFSIIYEPYPFFTFKHGLTWLCFSSIPRLWSYFFFILEVILKEWDWLWCALTFTFFYPEEIAISDVLICNMKCSFKYSLKKQKRMRKLQTTLDYRPPACVSWSLEAVRGGLKKGKESNPYQPTLLLARLSGKIPCEGKPRATD